MEGMGCFQEGAVKEDLVGGAEGEGEGVGGHDFAVFFTAAGAHFEIMRGGFGGCLGEGFWDQRWVRYLRR